MITPKLSQACYIVRLVNLFLSWDTLKVMCYAFFRSVMTYGIIFWGNSSHSDNIFRWQKRIIRITVGARTRDSCRELFTGLKILRVTSQYMCTLALYIVNKSVVRENSQLLSIKTTNNCNLFQPSSHWTIHQKGPH